MGDWHMEPISQRVSDAMIQILLKIYIMPLQDKQWLGSGIKALK